MTSGESDETWPAPKPQPTTNGASAAPVAPPGILRRLDSPSAARLVGLNATFEDLQSVLRCCERLMSEFAANAGDPDPVVVEAVWTMALLSYVRCFSTAPADTALTEDDVAATELGDDVLDWHKVLLQLRDHYADPEANPRERFSVVVTQDETSGTASGIGITSARQPLVDDVTVRHAGAIAFRLSRLVNDRIAEQQELVYGELKDTPKAELDQLVRLEVAELDQS